MGARDIMWLIGGPQGGGINVAAETMAHACLADGIRVFADIEYHSNIIGEHSYYRIRCSDRDRNSLLDQIDIVVSLDDETLFGDIHQEFPTFYGHLRELSPAGAAVYDAKLQVDLVEIGRTDIKLYAVPYQDLLKEVLTEFGRESQLTRLKVMSNTIAVGASMAVIGGSIDRLTDVIRSQFTGRRAHLAEMNVRAVTLAHNYVRDNFPDDFDYKIAPLRRELENGARPVLLRAMHSAAMGKLKAGLGLQTYYPISPATDESNYLETNQREYDLAVLQAEDEVAAINMAVGAAHAGVRAGTSTSGPGFSLMAEGMGFASMTEAPGLVVHLWQRGGPSTGLPTRQEHADLKIALQPGHGEFPHIVVAPGDVQETFFDSYEAFNWADRYQMPVVVLVDKHLSTAHVTLDNLDQNLPPIDRGCLYSPDGHQDNGESPHDYLRYAPTETGVSPRSIPGQEGGIFWTTSDEHDPRGHISEGAANRISMMEKRMGKLDLAAGEIELGRKLALHGPEDADITLISWGSTKGAILDVMEAMAPEVSLNFLQIRLLRPFPAKEVSEVLGAANRVILVENNYEGQLGKLVAAETGIQIPVQILKYDGRSFSQNELSEALTVAFGREHGRVHVSHLLA
jgi:2-oxoglutarate ferredoxin oxidoreductase subunit alpha